MADQEDATLDIQPNVPEFLRAIDEMVSKMKERFQKSGTDIKNSVNGAFNGGGSAGGGDWSRTPVAKTTKEMSEQVKLARELLKVEREKRDISRAANVAANRAKYGEDVELDENGNPTKQLKEKKERERRLRSGIKTAADVGGIGYAMATSGGSPAALSKSIADALSLAVPILAPIFQLGGNVAAQAFTKQDMFREAALQRYQVAGSTGGATMNDYGSSGFQNQRKGMGFTINQFTDMFKKAARAGALDSGADPSETMVRLMEAEVGFGLGSNVTGFLGAANKTGSNRVGGSERGAIGGATEDADRMMGNAFGVALQGGLSRGRLGEVFDQLTAAIEANTVASTDISATANRFLFISQLGAQYRGNTAASREMDQSIKGLAKGSNPYTQMTMLGAAGFGQQGVSYAEAWLSSQKGLDTEGGISSENLIAKNFSNYISAYARGSKQEKAAIVMTLSQLTGMNGAQVESILERLSKGPLGKVDAAKGLARMKQIGEPSKNVTAQRGYEAAKEDSFRFGIGDMSDAGDLAGTSSHPLVKAAMDSFHQNDGIGGAAAGGSAKSVTTQGGKFGSQRSTGKHQGEDLYFPPGSEVKSPTDGIVNAVGFFGTSGKDGGKVRKNDGYMIWIMATNGAIWKLYHLDPATVKVAKADTVKKGQVLGKTLDFKQWANGQKTHLHVGVMQNGEYVDPLGVDGIDSLVSPTVGSPGAGSTSSAASLGGGGSSGGAGASGGGGGKSVTQVNVKIDVTDRSMNGIDVRQETTSLSKEAAKPAPGDVPASRAD